MPVETSTPQSLRTPAEPLGTNRVYLRNGKGGSVRLPDSVPQAGAMDDDAVQLQSLQMEQAAEAILLEVGEDLLRRVRVEALQLEQSMSMTASCLDHSASCLCVHS